MISSSWWRLKSWSLEAAAKPWVCLFCGHPESQWRAWDFYIWQVCHTLISLTISQDHSHCLLAFVRGTFTFAILRFAADVYSSEDFLMSAQVRIFVCHTWWKVWTPILCSGLKIWHFCQDLLNSTTDATDRLNLEFFAGELKTFINGFPFHGFYFPISYLEGVQVLTETSEQIRPKITQQCDFRLISRGFQSGSHWTPLMTTGTWPTG